MPKEINPPDFSIVGNHDPWRAKAKCQSTGKPSQAALTLAQLLKFDSVKHTQKTGKCTGHVKRDSITSVHWCDASFKNTQRGSYKQIIFTWHVNFVRWSAMLIIRYGKCSLWTLQGDGYNIPSQAAKKKGFTIAAVDNIEHNTSSITAISSFHGTSISLIQYPTVEGKGVENARFKQRNLSA